jgi:hypothetical protein
VVTQSYYMAIDPYDNKVRKEVMVNHNRYRYMSYWINCSSSNKYVLIKECINPSDTNGRYLWDSVVFYTTEEQAEEDAEQFNKQYNNIHCCYVLDRDTYNKLRKQYNNKELTDGDLNLGELVTTGATNLKDKLVFAVWNMSQGKGVGAAETEEGAKAMAKNLAIKSPSETFLILAPISKVFQPVQVEFEDVTGKGK